MTSGYSFARFDIMGAPNGSSWLNDVDLRVEVSPSRIHFMKTFMSEAETLLADESICINDGSEIVAYAPISVELNSESNVVIQSFGYPLRLPIFITNVGKSARQEICKAFLLHLVALLDSYGAPTLDLNVQATLASDLGSQEFQIARRLPIGGLLMELGCETGQGTEFAWKRLRPRYRTTLRRHTGSMDIRVYTGAHTGEIEVLRRLHVAAAGRETRSDTTWAIQDASLANGTGILIVGSRLGAPAGAIFLELTGSHAYYSVGAFDRRIMREGIPIGHLLMWRAIEWLCDNSTVTSLGLGWLRSPIVDQSEKELGIEQFKLGFASTVELWCSLKLSRLDGYVKEELV